ncbi:hypothetical protein ACHQM5_027460 [Ranunculus cassubicifolius]
MAALSHSESRRLYSWWWDSHISPKNSKWLQENLTDMDLKVKGMIKILEQDGDSFGRKAEMYFKNRPELLKLVEEFYRAYRALAERYDHATGALRQAHKTMAEVFPDQDDLDDDSPLGSSGTDPHTPETLHPLRATLDPDDLHKDAIGVSSPRFKLPKKGGAYSNESSSLTGTTGLKQLNDLFGSGEGAPRYVKFAEGRMRKGLNYREEDRSGNMMTEIGQNSQFGISKENRRPPVKSEQASRVENEVQSLKNSLAKVEAEKDAGYLQYQHALEKLSDLEAKVSRAREDSREFSERSSRAETEVQALHEALTRLQKEKEDGLHQYQQCTEMMSNLENKMSYSQKDSLSNDREIKPESEAESLKQALARVEAERDASLLQYSQSLEKISKLETQLSLAEENARNLNERAVRAEAEVQFLKEAIVKAGEEKDSALLQYQRSLETISVLQTEVSHAHEEVRRLSNVLVMGVAQLNSTEEQYLQLQKENQSLQTEVDNLLEMMTIQKQELTVKNEEIERLQIDIEDEYVRSMEAEEALQSLQDVHSECPEEHRAFVLDVRNLDERFIDKKLEHQISENNEPWSPKEEHQISNVKSLSPALGETNLQDEIFRLKEAGAELDKEVEVLVDQKNALQEEIHILKEEINDLKTRHLNIVGQLEQVGLEPDCLGSSVKSLQEENSRLADICEKDSAEKISLWEKFKDMENILEKNALLENSLSEVNAAVELLREKVKELEDICQLLKRVNSGIVAEKELLISQLGIANGNAEKLSEKNTYLQNFLYDASVERDWLREKSNSLEEVCQTLSHEKLELVTAHDSVVSEFKSIQQKLDDLGRKYTDLEVNCSDLEKERESTAHQVDELQANLALVRQEYSSFMSSNEAQLAHLEENNHILREEGKRMMIKFEDEQDKAVMAQLEIFILQRCIKEMEERNLSLFMEYQKQLETSNSSERLARSLELENSEQQVKANSLFDQVQTLRSGIRQMASSLKVNQAHECQVETEDDKLLLQLTLRKIEDLDSSLWLTQDEKYQLLCENSVLLTLLGQLRLTASSIKSERVALDRDLKLKTEDLLLLQSERNILKSESDHLNKQIGVWEETLSRKGMELIETERNLEAVKSENAELYRKMENRNRECDEARLRIAVLELHNLSSGETNLHQHEEIDRLREVAGKLELEMRKLHKEIQEGRVREDCLSSEVQQIMGEIKLWDYEAEALYSNWQIADMHAVLFEEKLRELAGVCVSVEDERNSNIEAIEHMKERVRVLELENKGMKSELAAYLPAVASLNDSVTLLEDHVLPDTDGFAADDHETEVPNSSSNSHDYANKERTVDQSLMAVDGVSNLLALQSRIKRIETSVIEHKKLLMKENFDRNIKLDAAMREIQKLEQSGITTSGRHAHNTHAHNTEPESLVKDIPLDQVSHSSSYDRHAMSKRQDFDRNNEILELWETEEHDFDLDLTFEQKSEPVPLEEKSEYCSSSIQSDDWSSKSMTIPVSGGSKKKILERLASDAQKLMNLLLTVQDMKKTAQELEKFKTPKNDTELDKVKAEIDELEEAIMQLSGTNGKLSKRAETNYDLEETEKARRNRVSERARRASEKIGRLHIEVQRIQFVLARLDNKYKGKDRKVLLKDYLYGNLTSPINMKRKKPLLFSCVKLKSKW